MQSASKWKKYTVLFGVLFLLPIGFSLILVNSKHRFGTLSYFGPAQVTNGDTIHYQLPPFTLTDQEGDVFSSEQLKDKIWIASFFSTTNPNIVKITKRLLPIDFRYHAKKMIVQVHFSPTPTTDTPENLKTFLIKTTGDGDYTGKRIFLTGDSMRIDSIARNSFFIDEPLNSSALWLVDGDGHLRGRYNGNIEDEVARCMEDIATLKKEMDTRANND